ncbi:MAG: hypothetical protein AAF850_04290 [Pseudomonadota bacterium]
MAPRSRRPDRFALIAIGFCVLSAACATTSGSSDTPLSALYPKNEDLSARQIISRAHRAAGGETWRKPRSLRLTGYNVTYRDGQVIYYDEYSMHRVYADAKPDSRTADGRVRIEAKKDGETAFLLTFDGTRTYNQDGPLADQSANNLWSSNFGYGAIRNALDDGWTQKRLPDDLVDGRWAHFVELTDPSGGTTRFGIDAERYAIVYVGFDSPRGWHERRYSNFYSKPGISWRQPGRVRLMYDAVKQNEIIWTDFDVNVEMPEALFVVSEGGSAEAN